MEEDEEMPLTRFREGSKNRRLAELLLDGQVHDRAELAHAAGASVNAVPYVVKQLRLAGVNIERMVDDESGRVRYRVIQTTPVDVDASAGPGFRPFSPLGEEALVVTIISLRLEADTIEVRFRMSGWGGAVKCGVIPADDTTSHSGRTLSINALVGTLAVREVLLCPDGSVGLRVGNEDGTIDIVNIRDDDEE
jgi:biotin operon repressor